MARHLLQRAGLHFWSENGEVTRQMCENWIAGLVAGELEMGGSGGGLDGKVLGDGRT